MIVKQLNSEIWEGLTPEYYPDSDLILNQQKIHFDNGINFVFSDFLSKSYDQKNNNYSSFILTSSVNFYENFSLDYPTSSPTGFVTNFGSGINFLGDSLRYWQTIPNINNKAYLEVRSDGFFDPGNNLIFFELDFLEDNTCRISHNYSDIKYFLNYNFLLNKVVFLSGTNSIDSEDNLYKQKFKYVYNDSENLISFYYERDKNVFTLTKSGSGLTFVSSITGTTRFDQNNVFKVNPLKFNLLNRLSSFWFQYTQENDTNNLNVNCSKTKMDHNQLIVHTEYNNINSDKIPINFITQKNSLTPFSKNISPDDNLKQREYVSLNTGSYQEQGNLKFSSNYLSPYTEYVFLPEKITYFHTPITMGEYAMVNVNDTNLVSNGAIYYDNPEFSDKIWKKMSNYKTTSKFGNPFGEQNGTWLCTWLSGSNNINTKPVWYDRYYFPSKTTREAAFSASRVYTYQNRSECATYPQNKLDEIYDIKSELTFDPYTLYAYYRTGKKDILSLINQNKNFVLFEQINQYLKTDGTVLASNQGRYSFLGTQYGSCDTINSINFNNQFTFLFSLYSSNYSKPFGHTIVGNYKNKGISFYSERSVTPFVRLIQDNKILIYDTELNFIDSVTFDYPLINIIQLESLDDYFVLDSIGQLFQLDCKNTIIDSTDYSLLSATIDHCSDDVNTYFLVSLSGDIVQYNRKTEEIKLNQTLKQFSTVPMTNAQSIKVFSNYVYIMDGKYAQKYEDYRFFYLKNDGIVYEWNVFGGLEITRFFASSGVKIESFKLDDKNNFYIFDQNSTCHIFTSAGFLNTRINLPVSGTKIIHSDFSKIYSNGTEKKTIYAACSGLTQEQNIIFKITPENLTEEGVTTVSFNHPVTGTVFSGFTNSNYNKDVLDVLYPPHTFSVRIGLPNIYAYNDFDEINLTANANELVYGFHELALMFDARKGTAKLFVDGYIKDQKTFDPVKYSLSEIISEPLSFGSTQYFNAELFQIIPNIPNAFLISNTEIKDVFFFTKSLNDYEITAIQKLSKNIKPIEFSLPADNRNYTESVENFFKQRLPFNKSQSIDVVINNSKIDNDTARNYIREKINLTLLENLPYYVDIDKLVWKENV